MFVDVIVSVSRSGDDGVVVDMQTVTISNSGSATLNVAMSNDPADESNGSVAVSVEPRPGSTVPPTTGTATVSVSDNDDPGCLCDQAAAIHTARSTSIWTLTNASNSPMYWCILNTLGRQDIPTKPAAVVVETITAAEVKSFSAANGWSGRQTITRAWRPMPTSPKERQRVVGGNTGIA